MDGQRWTVEFQENRKSLERTEWKVPSGETFKRTHSPNPSEAGSSSGAHWISRFTKRPCEKGPTESCALITTLFGKEASQLLRSSKRSDRAEAGLQEGVCCLPKAARRQPLCVAYCVQENIMALGFESDRRLLSWTPCAPGYQVPPLW